MKDNDTTLTDRINLAQIRITSGQAPMRIPVEATDPDVVLEACKERIVELESSLAAMTHKILRPARTI